ncbi:MAG: AAA family ATPase, partial [Planctomycetales bacterium]|nr:AAA family ATPase [Planctomycetales bacterium]
PLDQGDYGLHLVYGPNEAGKSSALRALTQFLYGIPNQCKDNFIHANANLRIGGELLDGKNQPLVCVRRKGRTKTLRAADDTSEADMRRLAEMLAGVDEHAFVQRFGISYANLVAGGEAIALGKGDLSEVLFAAASGNARIKLLQQALDAEAGELFKPAGQKPTINKALSELKEAKSAIRERQLTTTEWKRNEADLTEARERLAEVKRQLDETQSELAKLRRIQEALPLAARRAGCLAELREVADAPRLPDDFTDRRLDAVSKLNADETTRRELQATLDRLEHELAAVSAPDELLRLADRLDQLVSDRATNSKAYVDDRPKLLRDLERLEQEANEIARDLGHDPDSADLDSWRLSKTERARIDELKVVENGLRAQADAARRSETSLQRKLKDVESRLTELPEQLDGTRLRQALAAARKFGDLDGQLAQKQGELVNNQAAAEKELKRLGLWNGTLDELESLAAPSLETVARFEEQFDRAIRNMEKLREELAELETRQTKLRQEIEQLQQHQAVPTETDLETARQTRETLWQLIRRAWLAGEAIDAEQHNLLQSSGGTDLAAGYESSVAKADEVADRLRREARQVERLAQLLTDEQQGALQADAGRQRLAESDAELARVKSEWETMWGALGIKPQSPREMRTWLARHESLLLKAAALRGLEHDAAQLREKIEVQRHALATVLSELAAASGSELTYNASQPMSLEQLINHGDIVLRSLDDGAQERRQLERDQKRLCNELETASDEAALARQQMDDWRQQWQVAIVPLRLPREATPAQASAVLESLDDLANKRREAGSLRDRIRDIESDAARFLNAVRDVAAEVDVAEAEAISSVEDALATVRQLSERLGAARETQSRLVALREQQ